MCLTSCSVLRSVFGACFQLLVYRYTVTSSYSASRFVLCCHAIASCQASNSVNSRGAATLMLLISLTFKNYKLKVGAVAHLGFHGNQVDAVNIWLQHWKRCEEKCTSDLILILYAEGQDKKDNLSTFSILAWIPTDLLLEILGRWWISARWT